MERLMDICGQWTPLLLPFFKVMATPGWWQLGLCFLCCSFLMIARLNAVERNGFEGTIVGTLVMPYFSGFPNLCFAYLLARSGGRGQAVIENCLVNNVTNLTLVLAIPALVWGLNLFHKNLPGGKETRINYLSLLLTLLALIFFTAAVWVSGRDGVIGRNDGFLLVGIFVFWQVFHVFDVLKQNARKNRTIKPRIIFDLAVIALCAWGIFSSVEGLLAWVNQHGTGWFDKKNIGVLSGLLMVLPNAFPAFYYAAVNRADIAYSSQIGDCHICIPLCIGFFAVFSPMKVPPFFETALFVLMGAAAGLFVLTAFFGKLPRWAGAVLVGLYGFFMVKGFIR